MKAMWSVQFSHFCLNNARADRCHKNQVNLVEGVIVILTSELQHHCTVCNVCTEFSPYPDVQVMLLCLHPGSPAPDLGGETTGTQCTDMGDLPMVGRIQDWNDVTLVNIG